MEVCYQLYALADLSPGTPPPTSLTGDSVGPTTELRINCAWAYAKYSVIVLVHSLEFPTHKLQ
jgi:hypothetical protein